MLEGSRDESRAAPAGDSRHGDGGSPTTFSTVKLTNVIVSSYDQAGSDDGASPMDEFSLRYGKVEFESNSVKAGFDFLTNKRI